MPRHNVYKRQEKAIMFLQAPNLEVQIIELAFTHGGFTNQAVKTKQDKYNPLISTIKEQGWIINPLIIIIA